MRDANLAAILSECRTLREQTRSIEDDATSQGSSSSSSSSEELDAAVESVTACGDEVRGLGSPRQEEGDDDSSTSSSDDETVPGVGLASAGARCVGDDTSDNVSLMDLVRSTKVADVTSVQATRDAERMHKVVAEVETLEQKLLARLVKVKSGHDRCVQFEQVSKWIKEKATSSMAVCGIMLSVAGAEAMLHRLRTACAEDVNMFDQSSPSPPRRSLSPGTCGPAPKTPSRRSLSPDACWPTPKTPPELSGGGGVTSPQHRVPTPSKSNMRERRKRTRSERVSFDACKLACIESHKQSDLWVRAPGWMVTCDHCRSEMPQHGGKLQGAEGRPQFAQPEFVCHRCASVN